MSINEMKDLKLEYSKLALMFRERGQDGAAKEVEKQADYWNDMIIDAWDSAAQRQG
jgi:hypothetical protein